MMADLKQERFQVREHSHHKRSYLKASLRRVACAVFLLGLVLPSFAIATAQQESSTQRKTDLEIQKLELEVAKLQEEVRPLPSWLTGVLGLRADARGLPSWLTGVFGLLASFLAGAATVLAARRARRGALDQSVHDKRLESYPELVKATERLAVYFPIGRPLTALGPTECDAMGRAMSHWYFGGGGLLMSVNARNAYFRLARALTRASLAKELRVPTFPKDAEHISVKKLKHYQKELKKHFRLNLNHVEGWRFGGPGSENERLSHRFKDYVFLQRLSSALRTRLSEDLRSRRRPS